MTLFALWTLREREMSTTEAERRITEAYATALARGLEPVFRAGSDLDVQAAIDRISEQRDFGVFGVIVYGPDARLLFNSELIGPIQSGPLDAVRQVTATGEPMQFQRELDNRRVFSILQPLMSLAGDVIGVIEVVQPLQLVRAEAEGTRGRYLANTSALLLAVTLVIFLLVRSLIARPLDGFVQAVQALGRGELGYRTPEQRGGAELSKLAREFNRMAEQLEQARASLDEEAEKRVRLARRLRETEKLAVVGNLAAGLGHEIAAPLHVIRGRAEMLRRKASDDSAQRNLRIITDQIDRITVIVRNLLDFSRRREPRLEAIEPATVLRRVVEFLDNELQRAGVEFDLIVDTDATVQADPDLMHQVFINVLMNAMQVMSGRAGERRITVHVHRHDAGDETVAIDIADTGPGINEHVAQQIFEPFFTTKGPGEGTGLGLAVVRSIVEEHGGTIDAENRAEGGARFRIRLPITPEPAHV
jgi:signal transduction histidine kinase